jgi:N6-adenosine-specific RNA methylase IME4
MSGPYRTIVADPPWHYGKAGAYSWRKGAPSGESRPMLAYGTMTVAEITDLGVGDLAGPDAHLYLWTTQRYLWDARAIASAWGFDARKVLVWCKPPTGFSMGGAYGNACEFALFCTRGSLPTNARIPRDWWEWPRRDHSAKPEAFLDLVEQVSPGPYLEIFARRARFGWDYAGDGSLGTVSIPGLRNPGESEAAA